MKMGNTRSPSRYDAGAYGTPPQLKLRRLTIPHYASMPPVDHHDSGSRTHGVLDGATH
jgi:hypothetical protein